MRRMIGHPHEFWEPSEEYLERYQCASEQQARYEAAMGGSQYREGAEHVLVGERQTGKTTLALEWLTEPGAPERVLVVINDDVADRLRKEAGLRPRDRSIVSFRSLKMYGSRKGVQYGIDEALDVLTALLGLSERPHLVTITTDPAH